eukprot:GHVP01016171.1.p1 GENE.GHVP01016171.1~~GHVP01016171.1.p1  ORF type:complete len:141 (+),score=6.48 GHVP01016171.1:53-424(+)
MNPLILLGSSSIISTLLISRVFSISHWTLSICINIFLSKEEMLLILILVIQTILLLFRLFFTMIFSGVIIVNLHQKKEHIPENHFDRLANPVVLPLLIIAGVSVICGILEKFIKNRRMMIGLK